jgi:FkbM family methyltransferase
MASVNSPIRTFIKPILFKLLGNRGYKYTQYLAKVKDIKNRLVEEAEMELLPDFVKEGDQVFDIGANYAYFSERLSGLVGKSGKVYAFEPIPFTYDVCKKVLNHFNCTNVELYKLGVGEKNEKVIFHIPQVDFGAISAGQAHIGNRNNNQGTPNELYTFKQHQEVECEIVSIDQLLLKKLSGVTFVKMDIEGAEYFALKGMKETLQKFRPVILIEIVPFFLEGFNVNLKDFRTLIENELAYTIYKYDKNTKKLAMIGDVLDESNHILIPKEKTSTYQTKIA